MHAAALAALAAWLACAAPASAETLDRVVASVDSQAITRLDVETEYRFERFVDGRMPAAIPDETVMAEVRGRLIDQMLLAAEAQRSAVSTGAAQAARELEEIRAGFSTPEAYDQALQATGLTRDEILQRLRRRDRILKMIDRRLRPDAWVEESQIQDYYRQTFLPEYRKQHTGAPPPMEKVEGQIRKILTEQKINQLLDGWLKDLKASHVVRIHSF